MQISYLLKIPLDIAEKRVNPVVSGSFLLAGKPGTSARADIWGKECPPLLANS
jgi:hypothetical protein